MSTCHLAPLRNACVSNGVSLALSVKKRIRTLGGLVNARPVIYPLRSVDTATVRYTAAPHGRRRITIDHRPLPGITPDDAARLVHPPRRHHGLRRLRRRPLPSVASDRPHPMGIGPRGAQWRSRRGRDGSAWSKPSAAGPNSPSTRLPASRNSTRPAFGSRGALRVSPCFNSNTPGPRGAEGVHYVTVMDLGVRSTLLSPVNGIVRQRFPEEKVHAWVKHNVEEVGQLEYLLPTLSAEAEPAQRA